MQFIDSALFYQHGIHSMCDWHIYICIYNATHRALNSIDHLVFTTEENRRYQLQLPLTLNES